jgi:hypothetical protein
MSTMKRTIATWLPVLCAGVVATAQGTQPGGEFLIQGIFNPTISEARKIDIRPQSIDTILPELPVNYMLLPRKADVPPRVDSIAPAKLSILAPQPRLYKGFVKGGFGLYTTPLGELYYDQGRSRNNSYGFHAKHLSSNGGIDDVGDSDYSFNSIDGFYKHFVGDHEVGGRLLYDRRRVSYYGFLPTDSLLQAQEAVGAPEDFSRQIYNDVGFAGRIRSMYKDSSKIAHDVDLEVHSYSNLTGSRETNVRIGAALAKTEGRETYGLGVLLDNNAYRGQLGGVLGDFRRNGTLLGLLPQVSTRSDKYAVTVGAGIYVDALGATSFHFFPQLQASYSLFDDILVPYVGIDGSRERNSFRSLTRENPWLVGAPNLNNSSRMYDMKAGLRGSFSREIGFDVRVSRSRIDNMPLFVNIPNPPFGDRMGVVYDRVNILTMSGELQYHQSSSLDLTARIDVNTYESRQQDEAWNLPPYELAFGAVYNLRNKLIVKGEALFLGRRKARGDEIPVAGQPPGILYETIELDGFLDMHLGLEYRYTRRLSVFLQMSNLSASKYERWSRYPVQRGLLLGGATYAF